MKVIFLVDNIPAIEMFAPIVKELPADWEFIFINHDGWTEKSRTDIEHALQKLNVNYLTVTSRSFKDIDKLLQKEQPNVVVLPRDTATEFEQSFIKCANAKQIPTLLVPHGVWAPEERKNWSDTNIITWLKHAYYLFLQGSRIIKKSGFSWKQLIKTALFWLKRDLSHKRVFDGHGGCSKIAAFGDSMKNILTSEGLCSDNIVVTGNPKFDFLYNIRDNDSKQNLCTKWDIPNDNDIVLVLTNYLVEFGIWTTEQRKRHITAIANAVSGLANTTLVIKVHPVMENELDYHEIFKNSPDPPVICKHISIPEILNACSLAITTTSTVGLEIMAMGKPLLIVNLFNDITLYDETTGAIVINDEQNLFPTIKNILNNGLNPRVKEACAKFVYQQAYLQDGKAANRISNLISQMAVENNKAIRG